MQPCHPSGPTLTRNSPATRRVPSLSDARPLVLRSLISATCADRIVERDVLPERVHRQQADPDLSGGFHPAEQGDADESLPEHVARRLQQLQPAGLLERRLSDG